MAKRNYGTVHKKIADLVADLTSKDRSGFFHNATSSDDLFLLLDAVLRRMPKDEKQAEVLQRVANVQTIGSMMKIDEIFGNEVKDMIISIVKTGVSKEKTFDGKSK